MTKTVARATLTDIGFSEVGLAIPPNLDFEEWENLGKTLQRAEHSAQWWCGDWAIFGEQRFGDTYYQAVEEYASETVRVAQWVASRIEPERRRQKLSWSHHRSVAALEPREQDRWLDKAESDGMSTRELYDATHEPRERPEPEPLAEPAPIPAESICDALRPVLAVFMEPEYLDDAVGRVMQVLRSQGVLG